MSTAEPPLEITCPEVQQKLAVGEDLLLLDCREPNEWELVHIEAAELLPMSQLVARVGELEPHRTRPIAVYCHHGGRSLQVTAWLRSQGFAHVQSLRGGIDQWAAEIEPAMPRY